MARLAVVTWLVESAQSQSLHPVPSIHSRHRVSGIQGDHSELIGRSLFIVAMQAVSSPSEIVDSEILESACDTLLAAL
jgi:hypothetical protein